MHVFRLQQRGFAHRNGSTTPVYAEIETWFTRSSRPMGGDRSKPGYQALVFSGIYLFWIPSVRDSMLTRKQEWK